MRRFRPYSVLDVFTDRRLAGNALAVVYDADGIDDDTMLAFARETRLSETTFVQSADADGADYRNRIVTVGGEVPFAGHPSLGTAVAVAAVRGESEVTYTQQTPAGLQPIDVTRKGDGWFASMLQEPPVFGEAVDAAHVMAAAGLVTGDAYAGLTPQVVSTGLPTLVALVRAPDAIERMRPDLDLVEALLAQTSSQSFYIGWLDGTKARARMFSPLVLGGEDPATGSAAGPLCAYACEYGLGERLEIAQGVEMGRPSTLFTEVDGDAVRVSGGVVQVIDGTVSL